MRLLVMTLLAVCVLFSLTSALKKPTYKGPKSDIFEKYKNKFHKKYQEKEENKRKKIIISKIKSIKAHNARFDKKEVTYYKALTSISDLTYAEYKKTLGFVPKANKAKYRKLSKLSARSRRPKRSFQKWDLRYSGCITPVGTQGECGACYAFAAIALIEYHYCMLHGGQQSQFSVQQIVECSWEHGNIGCYAGHYDYAFDYLNDPATTGLALSSNYPYIEDDWFYCDLTRPRVPLPSIVYINLPPNEESMKSYVMHHGPIAVGIHGVQSLQEYAGGIYADENCDPDWVDHAVTIIGYGVTDYGLDFWIVKNTNGMLWGEEGYVKIKRGVGMCGINLYPTGMHFVTA